MSDVWNRSVCRAGSVVRSSAAGPGSSFFMQEHVSAKQGVLRGTGMVSVE